MSANWYGSNLFHVQRADQAERAVRSLSGENERLRGLLQEANLRANAAEARASAAQKKADAAHRAGYELARAEAAEAGWQLRAYDVVMRGKG